MTFWVVRAGKYGGTENYALENGVVATGWDEIGDISRIEDKASLQTLVSETWPNETIGTLRIWAGELWALKDRIKKDDWVALPLKSRAAIAVGKVTGPYKFVPEAPEGARHQRAVKWHRTDLPRTEVDQDLLHSLGSILTVFRVSRNNAEVRLAEIIKGKKGSTENLKLSDDVDSAELDSFDVEQFAADQIVNLISQKFRGHELARLIAGILTAEGYQILLSPPGADGGVDIIAGTGAMGFEAPKLVVQVKSGETPADVSVVRELQGVMPRFGADRGLVVSWGGFKSSVLREARQHYFTIRLWDAGDIVSAIQKNYERLPSELQAELPLKQIWTLVQE